MQYQDSGHHRHPGKRLVIHTDRGCQYTSWDFRCEVAAIGGIQSMSRPGTPYDNACAETFFKTLKTECVERFHFRTRKEARDAIAKYVLFYNRVLIPPYCVNVISNIKLDYPQQILPLKLVDTKL